MDWMLCSAGALSEQLPKVMFWLSDVLQRQNVDAKLVKLLDRLRTDLIDVAVQQEAEGRAGEVSAQARRDKNDQIRKAFDLIVDARDEIGGDKASAARSARVDKVEREILAWFGCHQATCHGCCVMCFLVACSCSV